METVRGMWSAHWHRGQFEACVATIYAHRDQGGGLAMQKQGSTMSRELAALAVASRRVSPAVAASWRPSARRRLAWLLCLSWAGAPRAAETAGPSGGLNDHSITVYTLITDAHTRQKRFDL